MLKKEVAVNVSLALMLAAVWSASTPDDSCRTCGNDTYGTSIEWAGSPSEAAARALKEQKLVFVLHVSGRFEEADFT